jgi:CubicO group peptidase (beta-lactamase class C family)
MKVKMLIIAVLVAASVTAQQRRMALPGSGPDERTKDWPKAVATPNMTDAQVLAAARTYLDALVKRDLFSGTVMIAKENEPLLMESYGLANRDFNVPNTNDTKYNLGSVNKIFTQVALMQLRDAKKLDDSKSLRTYLPDYPATGDQFTIEQLLRHASGVPDFFGEEYMNMPKEKLNKLSDYLPLFANKPLDFKPGTTTGYSNSGYILLGLVVEKLSGMSYEDYVRTKIFKPLGMNDTGAFESDAVVPKRASNYTRGEDGVVRTNIHLRPGRGSSAGGGYSTVPDMFRFATGVKKILSPASYERFITSRPVVIWGGGGPGVNAMVLIGRGYTVIALANFDPPSAQEVVGNIQKLLGIAVPKPGGQ